MNTIKIDKYFKGMIANKGLSGIETENSIFAFLAAANRTYLGIGCDVFVSKDDVIITTADDTLLRLGLLNLYIPSFTYEELRKFFLVDRKTSNLNENIFIPKFEDFLSICKAYRKHAFVNIWSNLKHEHLERMLTDINENYDINEVSFISDNRKTLQHLKKNVENSKIFLADEKPSEETFDFCKNNGFNLFVKHQNLSNDLIRKMHLIGLKVATGAIDDKMLAERFIKYDIDFIFTNILE
jgi:glycerophosphoryl diester phosphodiesterase